MTLKTILNNTDLNLRTTSLPSSLAEKIKSARDPDELDSQVILGMCCPLFAVGERNRQGAMVVFQSALGTGSHNLIFLTFFLPRAFLISLNNGSRIISRGQGRLVFCLVIFQFRKPQMILLMSLFSPPASLVHTHTRARVRANRGPCGMI